VPGHDGVLPVDAYARGRGCLHRPKVSMMVMRQPQQGQGGSQPGGSGFDALRRCHGEQFAGTRVVTL